RLQLGRYCTTRRYGYLSVRWRKIKMNDQQRACLLIASRLLSYPANTDEERTAIHECIEEDSDSNALKMRLYAASSAIFDLDELEHKENYVSTFHVRSKLGLY